MDMIHKATCDCSESMALKGWESFREHPGAEVASDLIVTLCTLIVH